MKKLLTRLSVASPVKPCQLVPGELRTTLAPGQNRLALRSASESRCYHHRHAWAVLAFSYQNWKSCTYLFNISSQMINTLLRTIDIQQKPSPHPHALQHCNLGWKVLDFYSIAHLDRRRPTPNPVGHIRGVRTQVAQYNLPFCPQEAYTLGPCHLCSKRKVIYYGT